MAKKKKDINFKYNFKVYFSFLKRYKFLLILVLLLSLLMEFVVTFTRFLFKIIVDNGNEFISGTLIKSEFVKILLLVAVAYITSRVLRSIFTWLFSSFRITVPFVSAGATQVQFQPWYLFWTLPFVALLPNVRLMTVSIALAISASLRYLPYLYFGDWSHQGTIAFMQSITFIFPITAIIIIFLRKRFSK